MRIRNERGNITIDLTEVKTIITLAGVAQLVGASPSAPTKGHGLLGCSSLPTSLPSLSFSLKKSIKTYPLVRILKIKTIIKEYCEQLYGNKLDKLDEMDKFLERQTTKPDLWRNNLKDLNK